MIYFANFIILQMQQLSDQFIMLFAMLIFFPIFHMFVLNHIKFTQKSYADH